MKTSAEIRQSFLDFFKSKQHSIVPSASLMPTSPNLLFTNAGMNQFVPYFLGEQTAPYKRAADTQKCIRAGGKHNDLEDVGFDTYHHTFFEMLGNWSFGDYFKKEAIEWAWELLTDVWGFPKERLYATVYKPGEGDPAEFDQEAYDLWATIFEKAGLDPKVHIVNGNKKDNFWMMGDTGPCGPCSELHIDLTPEGKTAGKLVNMDSAQCIEIWNLVFIQFNAEPDGSFKPLAAQHVDTGMGFERVAGIMATTKNFTDFSQETSNYDSDLFTDFFTHLSEKSGHVYKKTLPENPETMSDQELGDVVFRVLADHIRTLSLSIADGILPGNEGRNYVLRRILRRAVMWGKRIGLKPGFFTEMVDPLVEKMSPFFPELKEQHTMVRKVIESEEKAFDRTLDRGLQLFEKVAGEGVSKISGHDAFTLYDTYGFPLDLTQLLARERGLSVDLEGFEKEMEQQRERARAAQKKEIIAVNEDDAGGEATSFVGFERENTAKFATKLTGVNRGEESAFITVESSPLYAEMGGQVGDQGALEINGRSIQILDTTKSPSGTFLHKIKSDDASGLDPLVGDEAVLNINTERRRAIERHHSATHILHWALREVLGTHVHQAGSLVTDERLRFDFAHFEAMKPEELATVERLVNERIIENSSVKWFEVPFNEKPEDVIAFFGDKYGDTVRVVDIGGFSKELCGGTHVYATGEIGILKLVSESAIAAGTRRIEAVAGASAYGYVQDQLDSLTSVCSTLTCPVGEVEAKLQAVLDQRKALEKELKSLQQKGAAEAGKKLLESAVEKDGVKWIVGQVAVPSPNDLRGLAGDLVKQAGNAVVILGGEFGEKVTVAAACSKDAITAGNKAGDLIREITGKLGGKGGGKPDFAMGGAPNDGTLKEILSKL